MMLFTNGASDIRWRFVDWHKFGVEVVAQSSQKRIRLCVGESSTLALNRRQVPTDQVARRSAATLKRSRRVFVDAGGNDEVQRHDEDKQGGWRWTALTMMSSADHPRWPTATSIHLCADSESRLSPVVVS